METDTAEDTFEYELEVELPVPSVHSANGSMQILKRKKTCGIPDCEPCNRLDCTTCKACKIKQRCLLRFCPEYAKKIKKPPTFHPLELHPPVPSVHGAIQNIKKKRMCGIPNCEPCNRLDCTTCKKCLIKRRCLMRYCPEYARIAKENRPKTEVKKTCSGCGVSYASWGNLRRHKQREGGCERNIMMMQDPKVDLENNMCRGCDRSFPTKAILCTHVLRCNGDADPKELLTCQDCGTSYQSKGSLNRHKLTQGACERNLMLMQDPKVDLEKIQCRACGKSFPTKATLISHVLRCNGEADSQEGVTCQDCGTSFHSRGSLNRHKLRDGVCERSLSKQASKPKEEVTCPGCGTMFHSRGSLRRHELRDGACERSLSKQASKLQADLNCHKCGTLFQSRGSLNRHKLRGACERILSKQASKNLTCDDCGTSYSSRRSLRRHRHKCKGIGNTKEEWGDYEAHCIEVTPNIEDISNIKQEIADNHIYVTENRILEQDISDVKEEVVDDELCDNEMNMSLETNIENVKKEIEDDDEPYDTGMNMSLEDNIEDVKKEIVDDDIADNVRVEVTPASDDKIQDEEEMTADQMDERDPLDTGTQELTESEQSNKGVMYECKVCRVRMTDKKQMELHLRSHFHIFVKCINT